MDQASIRFKLKPLAFQDPKDASISILAMLEHLALDRSHLEKKALLIELHDFLKAAEKDVKEPLVLNAIHYVIKNIQGDDITHMKEHIRLKIGRARSFIEEADDKIAKAAASKIPKGSVIFTHGHSSSVIAVLKHAQQEKKNIHVNITESRPTLQGRKTAEALAALSIPITYYVDSAMRIALKESDLALLGCNAITNDQKIISQIGSELCAETAKKFEIPLFICTNAWKIDTQGIFNFTNNTKYDHVWQYAPANAKLDSHLFEQIDHALVTAIISELGIFKPKVFLEEAILHYKFFE